MANLPFDLTPDQLSQAINILGQFGIGPGMASVGGDSSQSQAQGSQQPSADPRQAYIDSLAAAHKGQSGKSSPVLDTKTGKATPFDRYSFGDGSTVEVSPDGAVQNLKLIQPTAASTGGAPVKITQPDGSDVYYHVDPTTQQATPIQGLPASSPAQGKTSADALAAQGLYVVGNQVWGKDANGNFGPTTASQATQQLADAKTVADTQYQAAQTQKLQIDNALAADPTNQALKQQQTQAAIDLSRAQQNSYDATAAKDAIDAQVSQGNLAVSQGNLGVNQARATSDINTQTASTQIAQNKAPYDIAYTQAQTENQLASASSTLQKANEPTVWQTGTAAPTTTYYDPKTGQTVDRPNPSYLPTDPGRMQVQIQQQAAAQQQALQQQVQAGQITSDQAASQFDQWWQTNAEPIKSDIASAQAAQQSALATQQAQAGYYQAQAANLPATLALNASDYAQKNAISLMPYMVNSSAGTNPGFTTNAKGFPQINPGQIMQNATFSLPNLQEIGRQGAAAALANVSPTAAMHTQIPGPQGQPPVGGMPDLNSLLNQSNYGFGAAPQAAPAAPQTGPGGSTPMPYTGGGGPPVPMPYTGGGGPPTPMSTAAPAPAPPPFDWAGLLARQQQSAAEQGLQAQIPWGQYTPAMAQ